MLNNSDLCSMLIILAQSDLKIKEILDITTYLNV